MKRLVCFLLCGFLFFVACAEESTELNEVDSELYGSLAKTALAAGEFRNAIEAVNKAIEADNSVADEYLPIAAVSHAYLGNVNEAVTIYDSLYKKDAALLGVADLYMYFRILAHIGRYEDSEILLSRYFKEGLYVSELGLFAASLYQKLGDLNKSVLCSFLEYEYASAYTGEEEKNDFLFYTLKLGNGFLDATEDESDLSFLEVLTLIDATVMGTENTGGPLPESVRDFFVTRYCLLKQAIISDSADISTVRELMSLENYFNNFSAYHWTLWQAIELVYPQTKNDYIEVLKRVIQSAPDGHYAQLARQEACKIYGLDPSQVHLIDEMLF